MIRLSLNLPPGYRLDLNLVKKRKNPKNDSLLTNLGKIRRVKKGSKISRIFRHIFESKKLTRIFGVNLAVFVIASSFIPKKSISFENSDKEIVSAPLVLKTNTGVRYPVDDIKTTQGFKFYHPGIDFDGLTGDPVYPIIDGKVEAIQYSRIAYGNAILINHGNNITSLYAHLSKIFVNKDQEVNTDSVIGEIGATGHASGDHLHFEIRDDGTPINPLTILQKNN
jgi:murein DD-endopeptidase MepM/ murein hydrolase activator NlpD